MNETSGFYKAIDGELFYGPNWVVNSEYTLHRDLDQNLGFPVDGWMWYDSEEIAREVLGIPKPVIEDSNIPPMLP